ncbi:MAG: patatin-like phospholipase family protein [Bacillota bacterium]|nr:patatin-like phospholipase family protein [Bacillota bacterium]
MGIFERFSAKKEIAVPQPPQQPPRKKIGVAFGGGGLKGPAHLGVLKVLEEYQVPIDMVAGTSIGAAVAALYAYGMDWREMLKLFTDMDVESVIKVRPSRKGLIPADAYTDLIRSACKGCLIENMRLPLRIVTVDLVSRQKVILDHGDTALAVRASSAVPGVFTPVMLEDKMLVDGYILDNCPGGVVRDMGADVVLAISLFAPGSSLPRNMVEIINRSLDIATSSAQVIDADLILKPIPHHMDFLDTKVMDACFELGEQEARAHIDEILELTRP